MKRMKQQSEVRSVLRNWGACVCVVSLFAMLSSVPAAAQGASRISLDQAIDLALQNSPTIKAARTQIDQSKAAEVTAGLRPNPVLSWDSQYVPFFTPSLFSTSTLDSIQQFDVGAGYLIERGGKRQRRVDAARDQTHVTQAQVLDMERSLAFNVAQQFINVLLAKSDLEFALEALKSFRKTVDIYGALQGGRCQQRRHVEDQDSAPAV